MNDCKEKWISWFSLISLLGEGRESKAEEVYVGCKCKVVGEGDLIMRLRLLQNSMCFRRLYKRLLKWQRDEHNT